MTTLMATYARQGPCPLYFVALKVTGVLGRPNGTLDWALTITSFLSEFSNKPRIFIACLSFLTMSPLLTSFFLFLAFDNHLRQFENKNCFSRYLTLVLSSTTGEAFFEVMESQ